MAIHHCGKCTLDARRGRSVPTPTCAGLGGGQDVDEAIRQANANKDQLDPQAREALELLNKLVV